METVRASCPRAGRRPSRPDVTLLATADWTIRSGTNKAAYMAICSLAELGHRVLYGSRWGLARAARGAPDCETVHCSGCATACVHRGRCASGFWDLVALVLCRGPAAA